MPSCREVAIEGVNVCRVTGLDRLVCRTLNCIELLNCELTHPALRPNFYDGALYFINKTDVFWLYKYYFNRKRECMKNLTTKVFLVLLVVINSCEVDVKMDSSKLSNNEITFITSDSLKIYGNLYITNKDKPVILLFHQAGSNGRGEYKDIIPILTQKGFNVVSIDQRSGGQLYGNYNRTILQFEVNPYSYCDAYADLEGALNFIIEEGFNGEKIIWGSSYSAALAILLASNRPHDISAVLAFSPASGGPMQNCSPNDVFDKLEVPLLLLRPRSEMEYESVQEQYELAKANKHSVFISENGVHGSSMLDDDRTGGDISETWKTVNLFIDKYIQE